MWDVQKGPSAWLHLGGVGVLAALGREPGVATGSDHPGKLHVCQADGLRFSSNGEFSPKGPTS